MYVDRTERYLRRYHHTEEVNPSQDRAKSVCKAPAPGRDSVAVVGSVGSEFCDPESEQSAARVPERGARTQGVVGHSVSGTRRVGVDCGLCGVVGVVVGTM